MTGSRETDLQAVTDLTDSRKVAAEKGPKNLELGGANHKARQRTGPGVLALQLPLARPPST